MKILLVSYNWVGSTQEFCARGFEKLGHEVKRLFVPQVWKPFPFYNRVLGQIGKISQWKDNKFWHYFNKIVVDTALEYRPDFVFTINESCILPETLKLIRGKLKIPVVVWIADNPFDSGRFKVLPINLKYFTQIFVGEPLWIDNIKMLARTNKIEYLYGAVDTDIFRPVTLTPVEELHFSANVSFAGSAYGSRAEALYRIAILEGVSDMGLKIWGWGGWERSYRYFPKIKKVYQKMALNLEEMNLMNQGSKIVLNLSNPQCITAFQQRTFEIPASGGFQIADRRSEINRILPEFEVDQFSTIEELRELVKYWLNHPDERREKVAKLQQVIRNKHTFKHRMATVIELSSFG